MSPAEFAFLAAGLLVGAIGGAAAVRLARRAGRRDVRVTVTPLFSAL